MNNVKEFAFRRLLCDFHIPDSLENVEFDCPEYVKQVKKAHVQHIAFMAKSHYGNCFYNTKIGQKCKGLKQDILQEIVPLFHKNGITVQAYYNVWHNNIEGEKHPDWFQVNENGTKATGVWDELCLNSPYRE